MILEIVGCVVGRQLEKELDHFSEKIGHNSYIHNKRDANSKTGNCFQWEHVTVADRAETYYRIIGCLKVVHFYFRRELIKAFEIAKFIKNYEVGAFDEDARDKFDKGIDDECVELAFLVKFNLSLLIQ